MMVMVMNLAGNTNVVDEYGTSLVHVKWRGLHPTTAPSTMSVKVQSHSFATLTSVIAVKGPVKQTITSAWDTSALKVGIFERMMPPFLLPRAL